jgi:tetratricopeptide (TPR) repeat protein
VRATRAPRPPGGREATKPAPFERDEWIDDGPIREVAEAAALRGAQAPREEEAPPVRKRAPGQLDPEVVSTVEREAGSQRAGRYNERLTSAAEALGRGRYDDARRMVAPVLRDLPNVAMAHEIAGLAFYSTGQWRKAVAELEMARELDHSVRHHAVLADCYRALRRYDAVSELWDDLKSASPEPALMAEGRIVAAGALADQGDLTGALAILDRAREVPKKVREHHLRQWYVIADLFDRSGDVVQARRFFGLVAQHDGEFADVVQRLANLGR